MLSERTNPRPAGDVLVHLTRASRRLHHVAYLPDGLAGTAVAEGIALLAEAISDVRVGTPAGRMTTDPTSA